MHNIFIKVIAFIQDFLYHFNSRDVAQPGSALGLGPRCRRFESSHPDQFRNSFMTAEKKRILLIETQKSATQSGKAKKGLWGIHFIEDSFQYKDSLVGWVASESSQHQIALQFTTKDDALNYIKNNNLLLEKILEAPKIQPSKRSYADNFK